MANAKTTSFPEKQRDRILAAGLAVCTFVAFAPALYCDFVNLDDWQYVVLNRHVSEGLSPSSIAWAFTSFHAANWHPLTWLSLQLDASLWRTAGGGLDPIGFHLTNLIVHAANAALLFLALRAFTIAFWPSAATAFLFALHPLRVESVAWVTERKDVLCVFFGLLALRAYAGFVRAPAPGRYLAVALWFALSLLTKPMLVTLPFLLLVLDWWPLQRARTRRDWQQLVLEKLPLLALTVASCVMTYAAQRAGEAVKDVEVLPLYERLANAVVSYVIYLFMTAWPVGLAVFYPHPAYGYEGSYGLSTTVVIPALLGLAAVSIAAVMLRRRAPYVLVGWLWYLGTLVPVIGLVQVGNQGYADRYTYFPQVGILLALSCTLGGAVRSRPRLLTGGLIALGLVFTLLTMKQIGVWRSSYDLWQNAYRVSGNCPTVLVNFGELLDQRGDKQTAYEFFQRAVAMDPTSGQIHLDLGNSLLNRGLLEDAGKEFELTCRFAPKSPHGYSNLGQVYWRLGKPGDAERCFEQARAVAPDSAEVFLNLGLVKIDLNDLAGARECLEKALQMRNDEYPRARAALGSVLVRSGEVEKGLTVLNQAVQDEPKSVEARFRLANALEDRGRFQDAARHFTEALRLDPNLGAARAELGIVLARLGQDNDAVDCLVKAIARNPRSQQPLLDRLTKLERSDLARLVEQRLRQNEPGRGAASAP